MVTVSGLAQAAVRVYDKVVHDQVFSKNVLFSNVLKNVAQETGSSTKYITYKYGRNGGFASGSETMILPTAGGQSYLQGSIVMKQQFQSVSFSDVALQASKRSKEFLVNVLESEYSGAKEDLQRQLSREGWADGTGVLCRVNGSTGTTVTVDTPMVGKNPTDYISIGNGVMFASDVVGTGTPVYGAVTAITGNTTFTISADPTFADNDYVFLAVPTATVPTVGCNATDLMGLKGLIDDASYVDTFQGHARSSYPWLSSYVNDSGSDRSLTDALLHTTFIEAGKKGAPKFILTSWDVVSAYGQLLSPDRRYTSAETTLKGGFKGVEFNGIPMVADYDAPYNEAYFIDPSTLSVEDLAPISFVQENGEILLRSSTQAAYTATLRYYANLANSAPNKSSALRNVIK
jgi:hypothetical protein